jgi:hypothetical protein
MARSQSQNLAHFSRMAPAQLRTPPRHSQNNRLASRQSQSSHKTRHTDLPVFLLSARSRWPGSRRASSHPGPLHRAKTFCRLFRVLPVAADRFAIGNHESIIKRVTKPGSGCVSGRRTVRSPSLAEPGPGPTHLHRWDDNVLAFRPRQKHSSASVGPSDPGRPGLVGFSTRLASLHARRPRLLLLRLEVIRLHVIFFFLCVAAALCRCLAVGAGSEKTNAVQLSQTPGIAVEHRGHFPSFSKFCSTRCHDRRITRKLHCGQKVEPASVTMFPSYT